MPYSIELNVESIPLPVAVDRDGSTVFKRHLKYALFPPPAAALGVGGRGR